MNVREFVPPILLKLRKRANKKQTEPYIKEYESYSMAMKDCALDGYQDAELCNMIADKTKLYVTGLKNKPFLLNPTNIFLLSAINQFLAFYSKRAVKVLDFGGACGAHYFEIKRFIPENISLKWQVVETEQMVQSARESGLGNAELEFVSSIEAIINEIDFIHSSGALQYTPDPYRFIEMLTTTKADWLFFNRMMFNENNTDIITVQKSPLSSNGHGKLPEGYVDRILSYPHTTMSFQKFNSAILSKNYKLEWVFEESSGFHQINNQRIIGKGLLYKR